MPSPVPLSGRDAMDPPDLEVRDLFDSSGQSEAAPPDADGPPAAAGSGTGWLEEIVARLEEDPDESWPAFEGLSELEPEVCLQVTAMLAAYRDRPGVDRLLRLLGTARDPAEREAGTGGPPRDPGSTDLSG